MVAGAGMVTKVAVGVMVAAMEDEVAAKEVVVAAEATTDGVEATAPQ